MEYKVFKNGAYNIHTIKTDRFKNIIFDVIFRNNIDKDTIQERTLLFDILVNSCNLYDTKRDINLKLEELYNAKFFSSTSRLGASILSTIELDILNPKFTKDDYLEESVKLLFDFIFNPKVNINEFDINEVNTYKNYLKSDILCIEENPNRIAYERALKEAFKSSPTSIDVKGNLDTLDLITTSSLYKTYQDIIKHDYIDIFVIGDIDVNKIVDYINKYAKFNTIKSHKVTMGIENKTRLKVNKIIDNGDFSQSQILYFYNLNDLDEFDKRYTSKIYNMILGGGSLETKLYRNLREKNSLCYGVYSSLMHYDSLIAVKTSVDKKNIKLSCKLIEDTIKEMNNVSQDELNKAISSIVTSLNASLDSPDRIIDDYYFNYLGEIESLDERIKKYKSVTLDDIKRINKYLKLNTIYILEGDENE